MNDILVIDNFFNIFVQKELLKIVKDPIIKWTLYEMPSLGYQKNTKFIQDTLAFGHIVYHKIKNIDEFYSSYFMELFQSQIKKRLKKNVDIIRIQISLIPPNSNYSANYMPPHTDFNLAHNTLIYYINDCDGDTYFFNEMYPDATENSIFSIKTTITPKQGRACIFDGQRFHSASPSKNNIRIIINVNFIEIYE